MFLLPTRGEELHSPQEAHVRRINVLAKPQQEACVPHEAHAGRKKCRFFSLRSFDDIVETSCPRFFSLHGEKKHRFLLPVIAEAYSSHEASSRLFLPTGDGSGSSRESGAGSSGSPFSSPSSSFSLS
ncbi:hypothetical protein BHE74_00036270 [Ensete ventricosum]|nr:hypothetical protein GW17_00026227 [Ensete ventricosum]RWW56973.1 hypothetical protein BHE74_00036270 [Ensete ventricosum]